MKKTETKITRYEHGNYYIDIYEDDLQYEAWLGSKYNGISTLMFGMEKLLPLLPPMGYAKYLPTGKLTFEEFLEMVEDNLDTYISSYEKNMDIYDEAMETHFPNIVW